MGGGYPALCARADANLAVIENMVASTPWLEFLAGDDKSVRSNTSVCLKVTDAAIAQAVAVSHQQSSRLHARLSRVVTGGIIVVAQMLGLATEWVTPTPTRSPALLMVSARRAG